MAMPARFPIRFSGAGFILVALGAVPDRCRVEVDDGELRVRLSWVFSLDVPRAYLRSVALEERRLRGWGWGAHGWRGTWLVNGSKSGLVRIDLDPPGHARFAGIHVAVRQLVVSMTDPDALIEALT